MSSARCKHCSKDLELDENGSPFYKTEPDELGVMWTYPSIKVTCDNGEIYYINDMITCTNKHGHQLESVEGF